MEKVGSILITEHRSRKRRGIISTCICPLYATQQVYGHGIGGRQASSFSIKHRRYGSVIYGISDQYHKVDNMMISEYTGSCISLRLSSFPPRHLYVHTFRIPYPPLIQPIR